MKVNYKFSAIIMPTKLTDITKNTPASRLIGNSHAQMRKSMCKSREPSSKTWKIFKFLNPHKFLIENWPKIPMASTFIT